MVYEGTMNIYSDIYADFVKLALSLSLSMVPG